VAFALIVGPARGAVHPGVIVINDDGGGGVSDHVKFYNRIREAGIPVRIEGMCVSACTLVLDLPRNEVCITSTASFGFHLASDGDPNPNLTEALIRRFYPPAVQQWIKDYTRIHGKLSERVIYMTFDEIMDLDVLSECGGQ
jgi:hypothetical protein